MVIGLVIAIFLILGFVLPYNRNGYMRAFIQKEKVIEDQEREPLMYLVGGSNVAFGFSCEMLQEELGFNVYNTGLHAGLGTKCIIDEAAQNAKKDDIVVLALEEFCFTKNGIQNGESILADAAILHPTIVKRFGFSQWMTVIGGYPQYIKAKIFYVLSGMKDVPIESAEGYDCRGFNEFGDYTLHYDKPCHNTKITPKSSSAVEIDYDFIEYVAEKIKYMKNNGARVVMIPATLNHSSYYNTKDKIDMITRALEIKGIPYICDQDYFVFPDSLYYDSQRHLGYEGTILRTRKTIDIIKPMIAN